MISQDTRDSEERDTIVLRFSSEVLKTRDDAVNHRASLGVEREWREQQDAYNAMDIHEKRDMIDAATGEIFGRKSNQTNEARRSRVIFNIIRGKCQTSESRFSELQFPVDDKNWGIKTSKVPKLPGTEPTSGLIGAAQAGAPADEGRAELARSAMEEEIEDQLGECDYNEQCRKAASQAIKIGTGVLKGPLVVKKLRKVWVPQSDGMQTVHVMQVVEEFKPSSTFVSAWNIYPDPYFDGNYETLSYMWERGSLTSKRLAELAGVPGYNTEQIRKVLKEQPTRTHVANDKSGNRHVDKTYIASGAPYETWEYNGLLNKELLPVFGCKCPDYIDVQNVSVCIVFVNDRPIKTVLNTLDTGDIIYDFFQWVKVEGRPWGIGEPMKILSPQRVINAAWRMMMDNSGDSAGANIVTDKDLIPDNGRREFAGRKVWVNTGDKPAEQAFAQFQVQNNQQDYERIIDLALKFVDIETGTPLMAQGDQSTSPETLGGMQLLLQNSDSTRRMTVKQWDDQITRRHIRRYYDWNMQYNPRADIKGDMEVDPRGTSVLLVKDDTYMSLMQMLALKQDPDANIIIDWEKVYKQLFQARHLQDVINSDEKIEENRQKLAQQPPPVEPSVEAAKIRVEGDMQKTQLTQQSDMAEIKAKESAALEEIRLKRELAQFQAAHEERMEMMRLSAKTGETLESIKAQLAQHSMSLQTQKELFYADHEQQKVLKAHEHESKVALQPPVEPVGKAPKGHSYEK